MQICLVSYELKVTLPQRPGVYNVHVYVIWPYEKINLNICFKGQQYSISLLHNHYLPTIADYFMRLMTLG
jgi:hypothetical protein